MLDFPKHEGGLFISHNEHKSYYETVESAIEHGTYDREDWISKEHYEASVAQDNVWKVQWYPDTPVGSYVYLGADLYEILAKISEKFPKV